MKNSRSFFLLLIILFGFTRKAFSQNEYYDALKLKNDLASNKFSPNVGAKILFKYVVIDTTIDNPNDSIKALNDSIKVNPFLTLYSVSTGTVHGSLGTLFKQLAASVSGVDVTNIATGVAMLMIDRAKQELTITFFNRFKKFVEENPEFRVLFPKQLTT